VQRPCFTYLTLLVEIALSFLMWFRAARPYAAVMKLILPSGS